MCNVDFDPSEFIADKWPTARKPRRCDECGREIVRGEQYASTTCKWDGQIRTCVRCAHCDVLREWLGAECGGWIYTEIVDDVREHVREYGVPHFGFALARLVVLADHGWKRRGELVPVPAVPPTTIDRLRAAPERGNG